METPGWSAGPLPPNCQRGLRRRHMLYLAAGFGTATITGILGACGGSSAMVTAPPTTVTGPTTTATAGHEGSGTMGPSTARPVGTATPTIISAPSAAVTFSIWGDLAEKAAYEQLVAAFNQRQPGLAVTLTHTPGQNDYLRRVTADFAGGAPADLILLNYRRFATYVARGALQPVAPYLAGSMLLQRDAFYPQVLSAFTYNGQLIGIPQNASSLVIYYNKGLFDRAGLPYPKAGWTWDDFLLAAQALTRGTEQYGVGIEPSLIRLAPFIWQNGGDIVDNPAAPTRLTLDRPASAAAVQWFVDLQVRHKVAPDAVQHSAEDDESRFLNSRTAMFFDSRRAVPTLRAIQDFDWDVAPLPAGQDRASILHSDAYFLTAASRNKPAAWTFMEYANSPEGQVFIAQTGRTVPSIRAVAESPVFLEPAAKPVSSRVFLDAIPIIRPTITIDTTEQIENLVNNELQRAFFEQATVADAIATATARTVALFPR